MDKENKIELKEFRVHWSVLGIRSFAPLYKNYKGFNITKEHVREHHLKVITKQLNEDYSKDGIIWVPDHITIHEIKEIGIDE